MALLHPQPNLQGKAHSENLMRVDHTLLTAILMLAV